MITKKITARNALHKICQLCHIRGEKQALGNEIELALDEEIAELRFVIETAIEGKELE